MISHQTKNLSLIKHLNFIQICQHPIKFGQAHWKVGTYQIELNNNKPNGNNIALNASSNKLQIITYSTKV